MSGKRSTFETVTRINKLVAFLVGKDDAEGATLEEIMNEVYNLPITPSSRRMFNRDCKAIADIYETPLAPSRDDDTAASNDFAGDGVDTPVVSVKGFKGFSGLTKYRLLGASCFMLPAILRKFEAYALIAGLKLCRHFIGPLASEIDSLSKKLNKSLPANVMKIGESLSDGLTFLNPVSNIDKFAPGVMSEILGAIEWKKALRLYAYEDMAGNRKTIVISPYLLYFKYHTWYVWAGSDVFGYDKPGPFRLSRMQAVELLSTEEYVPSSQSKGELIKDLKLDYHPANKEKMFDIKLRITGNFVLAARQTKWFEGDNAALQKDGSLEYTVKLKGLEAITLWVMRSLDSIEVLEPKELRDEIDRRVNVYLARRR